MVRLKSLAECTRLNRCFVIRVLLVEVLGEDRSICAENGGLWDTLVISTKVAIGTTGLHVGTASGVVEGTASKLGIGSLTASGSIDAPGTIFTSESVLIISIKLLSERNRGVGIGVRHVQVTLLGSQVAGEVLGAAML